MSVDNTHSQQTHRKGKCQTTSALYRDWRHLRFPSISMTSLCFFGFWELFLWECSTIIAIFNIAESPLNSTSLAFLLLLWSVLLRRSFVRSSSGPTESWEQRKNGKYRQIPGQVSSGHTFYVLQGRNSDPTAVLRSIWGCRSSSLIVWSMLRQLSPKSYHLAHKRWHLVFLRPRVLPDHFKIPQCGINCRCFYLSLSSPSSNGSFTPAWCWTLFPKSKKCLVKTQWLDLCI